MKDRNHKRQKLIDLFMQDIYERELSAGERAGSLRKLASRFQTTPQTVSYMLNDLAEQGILKRDDKGFFVLAKVLPRKPKLGYAGHILPGPGSNIRDCLARNAVKSLFTELEKLDAMPRIIGYHELQKPELAEEIFSDLNGLLISSPFIDNTTSEVLKKLNIPIVRLGQTFSQDNELNCSEVVQYMLPALEEFAQYCDLASYKKIINLHSHHTNGKALQKKINDFLCSRNLSKSVENILIPPCSSEQAEMEAYCTFMAIPCNDWSGTLVISGSEFFARGLCRALRYKKESLPDILSIDNFEDYEKSSIFPEPYLTAIDRNMGKIYRDAARLLCQQVRDNDDRKVIIKIPAQLIIRKSITHINKNWGK